MSIIKTPKKGTGKILSSRKGGKRKLNVPLSDESFDKLMLLQGQYQVKYMSKINKAELAGLVVDTMVSNYTV